MTMQLLTLLCASRKKNAVISFIVIASDDDKAIKESLK